MPGTFTAAIVFAALGTICLGLTLLARAATRKPSSDPDAMGAYVAFAIFTGVFAVLVVCLTVASSWNPVGTQDIGIVTAGGQPVGHIGPGWNFTAPWDQVTPMDEAIQKTDNTFTVRIAGGQTAQATVQIRWRIVPSAADDVFRNYRNSTSGVEDGLLTLNLNAATNAVLDGYDPLTLLAENIKPGTPNNPSTTQLAAAIQANLTPRLGNDVQVVTLVLQPLAYDDTVQNRINSITEQIAKTDVAKQALLTANAQAAANKALAQNLASNPLVLVQQCFTAIADGAFTPPAGFSCWPGSGSGVVIPSTSGK